MGKQARARKANETRITLPKEDYYELRTRIRDVEAIQFDAMKAAQEFGRQIQEAHQRSQATFNALAKTHGFDPALNYRWEDATCELIVTEAKQ